MQDRGKFQAATHCWEAGREGARLGWEALPIEGVQLAGLQGVVINGIRYNGSEVALKGAMDRFALPRDFRKSVKDSGRGERILCLQIHETLPCLIGFGLSRQLDFDAELDRAEEKGASAFDVLKMRTRLYGYETVPFDESGRFTLPEGLASEARLTDRLYFQGAGREFLIFNPDEVMLLDDDWRHLKLGCAEALRRADSGKARK